ncbi:MAG: hypothetical protein FD138_4337 [Planctomycetota bacterium]|nr:MAG: hypothetical protein FD138_4337 [Planctomycetota bacterium]
MKIEPQPRLKTDTPSSDRILDEYKILVDERRFVMTQYVQSLALYIALVGLALRESLATNQIDLSIAVTIFVTCMNFAYWYGARQFRSMAHHALNREALLADVLGFQHPHPMLWGYYCGISAFIISECAVIVLLVKRLL